MLLRISVENQFYWSFNCKMRGTVKYEQSEKYGYCDMWNFQSSKCFFLALFRHDFVFYCVEQRQLHCEQWIGQCPWGCCGHNGHTEQTSWYVTGFFDLCFLWQIIQGSCVGRDFKAGIETAFNLKRQKSTWIVSENEMIMIWYEMKALKSFELSCSQSNVWRNWIKRWRQWLKYLLLVEELTTCMVQPIDRLVDQEPGILDWKRPWLRSDNSCRNPGNLFWYCQFYTCLIWLVRSCDRQSIVVAAQKQTFPWCVFCSSCNFGIY